MAASFRLQQNQRVLINEAVHICQRRIAPDAVQFLQESNGALLKLSDTEMMELWRQNLFCFLRAGADPLKPDAALHFLAHDKDDLIEATRRLDFIKAVPPDTATRDLAAAIALAAQSIKSTKQPPSPSTFREWRRRYSQSGEDPSSLVRRDRAKGRREPRLDPTVEKMIQTAIDTVFMTPQRFSAAAVIDNVRCQIDGHNERPGARAFDYPSDVTIRIRIRETNQYQVLLKRYGKKHADEVFKAVGPGPEVSFPLEAVEIDHSRGDVILVDNEGRVLGRPTLTTAVDRFSRMLVGYQLSYDPPSAAAVMRVLDHMIRDKTYVAERYPEISGDWPCFGLPSTIIVDNGAEFHSNALKTAAAALGIAIVYAPTNAPSFKGKVERFFRTLNEGVFHRQHGTTFSNTKMRKRYRSEVLANVNKDELEEDLHKWLIGVYFARPHGMLGAAPRDVWNEGVKKVPPRMPYSEEELKILLTHEASGTLSREGIRLHDFRYGPDEVAAMYLQHGPVKVKIQWNPDDLGTLWIVDPGTERFVELRCTDPVAHGLTRYQHQATTRQRNIMAKGTTYHQAADKLRRDGEARARKNPRKTDIKRARLTEKKVSANAHANTNTGSPNSKAVGAGGGAPPAPTPKTFDLQELKAHSANRGIGNEKGSKT